MSENAHNNKIWLDIKSKIEYMIICGNLKVGEKVPSITEASVLFDCGKSTAQKVLDELCDEGIIQKKRGVGYFLKPYAREQILEKYKERWGYNLEKIVSEINELHLDSDDIEEIETLLNGIISSIEK